MRSRSHNGKSSSNTKTGFSPGVLKLYVNRKRFINIGQSNNNWANFLAVNLPRRIENPNSVLVMKPPNISIPEIKAKPITRTQLKTLIANGEKDGWSPTSVTLVDNANVSKITDFSKLFFNTKFTGSLTHWDVSRGNNFGNMFQSATKFNGDLSKWDVSRGNNFNSMFASATSFNSDLSGWTVSNGIDFSIMFANATSFDRDLGRWDVSRGNDFEGMFFGATCFNSNLSNWNVSSNANINDIVNGADNSQFPCNYLPNNISTENTGCKS